MLFFIERDELDIYDIPIFKITTDFLDYLHHLEKMEIEVASEFILFAATLMRVKSKMLLPRPELNEEGEEIDPREELIRNLLEYKKYKSVIGDLSQMEFDQLYREKRGNILTEIYELSKGDDVEAEVQHVDLYKLMKVFQKKMAQLSARQEDTQHTVIPYPYTISQQKDFILERISLKKKLAFTDIIDYKPEKIFVIYSFLAILELLQLSQVTLIIGEGFNNFWVEKTEPVGAA